MRSVSDDRPGPPFGYTVCRDCGVAVQRRLLADEHECGCMPRLPAS